MFFLQAELGFFAGISGSGQYTKRSLELDKDFEELKDKKGEQVIPRLLDAQEHLGVLGHLGVLYKINRRLNFSFEGFGGSAFGGEMFKVGPAFGARASLGIVLIEDLNFNLGLGVQGQNIQSVQIGLRDANYQLGTYSKNPEPLEARLFVQGLVSVGLEYFVSSNISVKLDGQILFGPHKSFEKVLINAPQEWNKGGKNQVIDQISKEGYFTLIRGLCSIYYYGGVA